MKRTTILLADDHDVVLEGLRRILDRPELKIVGAVTDGRALVQAAAKLRPDIIVTDVAMPLLNGMEAARQIHKRNRKPKFIFLSMHREVAFAKAALAAEGSYAYVLKNAAGEELIQAIRAALDGRAFVTQSIAKALEPSLEGRAGARNTIDGLTDRQREVLRLLVEGRQAKEIAAALNVSPRTVEFHKYRIMDTLGVRSVAELTRYAFKNGIVA